jgi:hypothetical protein
MQWRPFVKNRFDCIRKNRFWGLRHDFGVFFWHENAKTHEIMGVLAFFYAKHRATYTDEGKTFLFWNDTSLYGTYLGRGFYLGK